METNTSNTSKKRVSIFQQLSGAVIGGSLAFVLYYAYDYGSPVVQSWLIRPGHPATLGENRVADADYDDTDSRHVQAQARRIASSVRPIAQYTQPYKQEQKTTLTKPVEYEEQVVTEEAENIWGQEWTDKEPIEVPVEEVVPLPPPVFEPVTSAEGEPIPVLPDSGFGVWMLIGMSGAGAGTRFIRKKKI